MQKQISIILILIFGIGLIAPGALAYVDCESRCCCQTLKAGHGQVSHVIGAAGKTSFLKAASCCSVSMAAPCKLARGSAVSFPETCLATVRSEAPELSGMGLTSISLLMESAQPKIYPRGPDPWLKTKPLPIYLQNLTFLYWILSIGSSVQFYCTVRLLHAWSLNNIVTRYSICLYSWIMVEMFNMRTIWWYPLRDHAASNAESEDHQSMQYPTCT